ncbi:PEP-CTERM sorting domain-containing protein [Salinimonas marina]|uniref:PEP-CTERM sorting domain-containing protein n=1 Tax=Salinimonas marina TaxID=2785918 RepID=A0A7S9DVN9_9ALTE|nr:PEP-CTERM sorting domain-containing protein [Salinimonas marina]QPG04799.1 PEP-CTERM sorting domain-containing protein [Salinimonas marina]
MKIKIMVFLCGVFLALPLSAAVVKVASDDFTASANVITFSEFPLGTVNPTYTPAEYAGDVGDPTITFGGFFMGQSLSATPGVDCPGAAASACIVGTPTGPLMLDPDSPDTFTVTDGSNPSSPVLSGTPTFNGGIALLFSEDQFAVGFDGGFFNAVASTAITAFARDGSMLGSIGNDVEGIEFLGLALSNGASEIAGVFLDLIGAEPAGFAIDNVRFGTADEVDVIIIDDGDENGGPQADVPEPATIFIFTILCAGLAGQQRLRHQLKA